jgi:hypothetical protein
LILVRRNSLSTATNQFFALWLKPQDVPLQLWRRLQNCETASFTSKTLGKAGNTEDEVEKEDWSIKSKQIEMGPDDEPPSYFSMGSVVGGDR